MSDRVAELKRFHATRSFGTRENLIRSQDAAGDLYRQLDPGEVRAMAEHAIGELPPDRDHDRDQILLGLACFHPGSLADRHAEMLDWEILHPSPAWHGATPETSARLIGMLTAANANAGLMALAWIGDHNVREAFLRWRTEPPAWASALYVPSERYAEEAGWQLAADGTRRDLFRPWCVPLVVPGDPTARPGIVRALTDHDGTCRWCQRPMTTMLDLDLAAPELAPLGLPGRRLRIAACDICSQYATMFTRVGPDGESAWHDATPCPPFLPRDRNGYPDPPRAGLELGGGPRPWVGSSDLNLPGVRFTKLGGIPAWDQDATYPPCPDCRASMPFVAQVNYGEVDPDSEGNAYLFTCPGCGVAAVVYQQT